MKMSDLTYLCDDKICQSDLSQVCRQELAGWVFFFFFLVTQRWFDKRKCSTKWNKFAKFFSMDIKKSQPIYLSDVFIHLDLGAPCLCPSLLIIISIPQFRYLRISWREMGSKPASFLDPPQQKWQHSIGFQWCDKDSVNSSRHPPPPLYFMRNLSHWFLLHTCISPP